MITWKLLEVTHYHHTLTTVTITTASPLSLSPHPHHCHYHYSLATVTITTPSPLSLSPHLSTVTITTPHHCHYHHTSPLSLSPHTHLLASMQQMDSTFCLRANFKADSRLHVPEGRQPSIHSSAMEVLLDNVGGVRRAWDESICDSLKLISSEVQDNTFFNIATKFYQVNK